MVDVSYSRVRLDIVNMLNSSNAWRKCKECLGAVGHLVVVGSMGVTVGVVVLEEDSLICEVASKGDSSYSETRERALEAVPARERTGVSPCLAVV